MGKLAGRIRELMKQHDLLTEKELSIETGVPQPTIHRILAGNTKIPRKAALKAFADFFKIPLQSLLEPNDMAHGMEETLSGPGTKVPLLGWTNIREQVVLLGSNVHHYVNNIITFKKLDGTLFALVVEGDDLEPRFSKGTFLVFKVNKEPKNRDFVLVLYNNAAGIKQILIDGSERYLKSLDADLGYPVARLNEAEEVIGILVQSISEYGN